MSNTDSTRCKKQNKRDGLWQTYGRTRDSYAPSQVRDAVPEAVVLPPELVQQHFAVAGEAEDPGIEDDAVGGKTGAKKGLRRTNS